MKKVAILYKFLPQYRYEFFQKLREELIKENIELQLIYGKNKNVDSLKSDEVDIDWGIFVPNKVFSIGKTQLIWQPCLKYLKGTDLVIVEQASKLLINYYFMFTRKWHYYRFANWGHGRNMQDVGYSTKNKFKYLFLKKCDWWFAYTNGVRDFLTSFNYPAEKITVVQNAIDTVSLRKYYNEITNPEVESIKKELGISSENVGIYCGGMYAEKRLDFIIESCKRIREQIKDFHMILVGSGIDSDKAKIASEKYDWIHYLGSKFGRDKVKYFRIASVQLMPGLVGLGILDSFALETPIITTKYPFHSPEIEYLESGVNGIITEDNLDDYVNAVTDVFSSRKYNTLVEGCVNSAKIYTVEKMVDNFKKGVIQCLSLQKK